MLVNLHWSALLALSAALSTALSGCNWIDGAVTAIKADLAVGQQSAMAAPPSFGFTPSQRYPRRDRTYDAYLSQKPGLTQWQLNKLFSHIAMPQSHSAMVSVLGYPDAEQGDYLYWKIAGGSSELAVRYQGNTAYSYTVGY